jgi:Ca2+-binding EF-hand superfamily protein
MTTQVTEQKYENLDENAQKQIKLIFEYVSDPITNILDLNGLKKSLTEFQNSNELARQLFDDMDSNKDQQVSFEEFAEEVVKFIFF